VKTQNGLDNPLSASGGLFQGDFQVYFDLLIGLYGNVLGQFLQILFIGRLAPSIFYPLAKKCEIKINR